MKLNLYLFILVGSFMVVTLLSIVSAETNETEFQDDMVGYWKNVFREWFLGNSSATIVEYHGGGTPMGNSMEYINDHYEVRQYDELLTCINNDSYLSTYNATYDAYDFYNTIEIDNNLSNYWKANDGTEVRNFNTTANISAYRGDFTELFAQGYEFVSDQQSQFSLNKIDAGTSKLRVYAGDGTSTVGLQLVQGAVPSSNANSRRLSYNIGETSASFATYLSGTHASDDIALDIYTSGNAGQLYLNSSGRVGINRNPITYDLEVQDDIYASDDMICGDDITAQGGQLYLGVSMSSINPAITFYDNPYTESISHTSIDGLFHISDDIEITGDIRTTDDAIIGDDINVTGMIVGGNGRLRVNSPDGFFAVLNSDLDEKPIQFGGMALHVGGGFDIRGYSIPGVVGGAFDTDYQTFEIMSPDGSAWFNGTMDFRDDVNVTGNFTGNQIYGEMYNKSDAGFELLDLVDTDVYVPVTALECGLNNGFSCSGGNLTAQVDGVYKTSLTLTGESAGNSEYGAKLFINSVGQNNCYSHVHFKTGDANAFDVDCLVSLSVGDDLQIKVDDHVGSPNDISLKSMNLNLVRVGN